MYPFHSLLLMEYVRSLIVAQLDEDSDNDDDRCIKNSYIGR